MVSKLPIIWKQTVSAKGSGRTATEWAADLRATVCNGKVSALKKMLADAKVRGWLCCAYCAHTNVGKSQSCMVVRGWL